MARKRKPSKPGTAAKGPKSRRFRLIDDGDEEGVKRLSIGADPFISLALGESFSTADPKLAERLAVEPLLEEIA